MCTCIRNTYSTYTYMYILPPRTCRLTSYSAHVKFYNSCIEFVCNKYHTELWLHPARPHCRRECLNSNSLAFGKLLNWLYLCRCTYTFTYKPNNCVQKVCLQCMLWFLYYRVILTSAVILLEDVQTVHWASPDKNSLLGKGGGGYYNSEMV